ncbi:hypothetical protein QTP88_013242 [Uroleucon formosanum]
MTPYNTCENVFVHLTLPEVLSVFLAGVYLPPDANISVYESHAEALDRVRISSKYDFGFVCGDFNMPNVNWSVSDSGLFYTGSITDKATDILVPCDIYHPALSISCPFPSTLSMLDVKHTYFDFKNANYERIIDSLESIDWYNAFGSGSADYSANFLQKSLLVLIRDCVPLSNFRNSTFLIWTSRRLKELLAMKKQLHKQFKMLGGHNRYLIFSRLRAQCKFESKRLYSNYLRNMQERLSVDPKSFWGFIRRERGISTIPDEVHLGESKASGNQVSSLFASHFSSVYGDPRFISNDLSDEFTNHQFLFLSSKLSISIDDVNAALNSLSNARGSGPDGISVILLYRCRVSFSLPVTLIFNQSLLEGVFPSVWKISRVTPILKSDNPADVANYRPISGLPLLGKLFEFMVLKRIKRSFLTTLSNYQHGFFPGRSTSTSHVDFVSYLHRLFKSIRLY